MRDLLVINAGSSSIKFAVFDAGLSLRLSGMVSEIGGAARLTVAGETRPLPMDDNGAGHGAALDAILSALAARGIAPRDLAAAAHRVVHGGAALTAPRRITPEVWAEIAACIPLAPLHNPHNLAAIDALARLVPDLPQFASFDTAFHATNPEVASRYALPRLPETEGIRRYGFHGISYASLVQRLPEMMGGPLPRRLLALHLGNGASICAIAEGQSVATTMGYSPLEGLTMGTRAGGIDANAVLRLAEEMGVERVRRLLNHESGLLGLSGRTSDMRQLMEDGRAESAFSVAHFCYWARRHAGSLIAAMEGVDAIAFTGGIGENAGKVREEILRGLGWLGLRLAPGGEGLRAGRLDAEGSAISVWVVPAEEERMIAADALRIMAGEAGNSGLGGAWVN